MSDSKSTTLQNADATEVQAEQKHEPLFHVVLKEPEIPNNTGNIGRTCVGCRSKLHLVEPLGFEINDKQLRRAGLDYWPHLSWQQHAGWQDFLEAPQGPRRLIYFTTKTDKNFFDFSFQPGDGLVFGKETKGLEESLFQEAGAIALKVPMLGPIRSHNLANTVSIVLYEGLRQNRGNLF